jgi:hypothetical protein
MRSAAVVVRHPTAHDRRGLKPAGKGWIVDLQPGHFTQEFELPAVSQMVLNAITWQPTKSKSS